MLPDGTTRWLNKNGTEDDEEELSLQNHEPNVMEQPHQQENPVSVKQNFVEVQDDYSFKKTTASTVTEQAHENISNDSNQSNVQSKRLEEYLNQPNLSTIPPPPTNVSHLQSSKLQQSSNAETEEQLMYQLRTLELERLLAYTQKKQLNQTRIKDKEIEDLRNKVNKAKEAEDMARIDLQRALAKAEASHKAAIASLKSENERLKNTLDNKPTSLLSGLLGTGQPSSKVQAKINANQNEREIARYIEQLKAECEKEKQRGDKYKVEAQQYLELATSEQFKVGELNEEIAKLKAFMGKMEAKIRALKTDRQGNNKKKKL